MATRKLNEGDTRDWKELSFLSNSFHSCIQSIPIWNVSAGSAPHAVYEELADLPGITQEIKGVLKRKWWVWELNQIKYIVIYLYIVRKVHWLTDIIYKAPSYVWPLNISRSYLNESSLDFKPSEWLSKQNFSGPFSR